MFNNIKVRQVKIALFFLLVLEDGNVDDVQFVK